MNDTHITDEEHDKLVAIRVVIAIEKYLERFKDDLNTGERHAVEERSAMIAASRIAELRAGK